MKRILFTIAILLLGLTAPLPAQTPLLWAELWKPAIKTWMFIADAEEIAVPVTHAIRVLAVDATSAPGEQTVWYVLPRTVGHVTPDDASGMSGVFMPLEVGTCQIWARTGTQRWRVLTVHVVTEWPWRSRITTGESWLKGSR